MVTATQKIAFYNSYAYFPVCEEKNKAEVKKHNRDNGLKFLALIPIVSTIAYIILAIKEKIFKQQPKDEYGKAKALSYKILTGFAIASFGLLLLPVQIFATAKLLQLVNQEKKQRVIAARKTV